MKPVIETGSPGPSFVNLARKDLDLLRSRDLLRTTAEIEEVILLQSMEGRAHSGHGAFTGHRFVSATEDDLVQALRLDSLAVRRMRQAMIGSIVDWAHRAIRDLSLDTLVEPDGRPLLGMGSLAFWRIDAAAVLRGLYLGGLRDTLEVREATEKRYKIVIGAGRLYPVDVAVMHRMGLTGEALARDSHADNIDQYRRVGLISESLPLPESSIRYLYVRHHAGPGASDDAAIVGAGLRFGADVAAGVFLADAIDTLEKYVPPGQEGDQDAALARQIEDEWDALNLGLDEACELTYLSVGGDGIPDSSLRHLLRIDRAIDQCPIEAHLLHAAGRPYAQLELAHEKLPNDRFYEMLEGRIERLRTSPTPGSTTRH